MPGLAEDEFIILNYIDIKYAVDSEALKSSGLVSSNIVEDVLSRLKMRGYLKTEESLLTLTEEGQKALSSHRIEMLKALGSEAGEKLGEVSEKLNNVGYYLRFTVARHQLRADGRVRILESLEEAHEEIKEILEELSKLLPHFKQYLRRLGEALQRIKEGDDLYIVWNPNSYYNVYSEMRADLAKLIEEDKRLR